MKNENELNEMHDALTRQIIDERNQEMAANIAEKRRDAARATQRYDAAVKTFDSMGINVANLDALEREHSVQDEKETMEVEAQMEEFSQNSVSTSGLDVEASFLPDGAHMLKPSWVAAFSDDDSQDELTSASVIPSQALLSGGCKNYYNWAKGSGSGLFGTGVGKIQSWVDFGFWFKPPTSRFYSIRPLFRFRGYIINKADDGFFDKVTLRCYNLTDYFKVYHIIINDKNFVMTDCFVGGRFC